MPRAGKRKRVDRSVRPRSSSLSPFQSIQQAEGSKQHMDWEKNTCKYTDGLQLVRRYIAGLGGREGRREGKETLVKRSGDRERKEKKKKCYFHHKRGSDNG